MWPYWLLLLLPAFQSLTEPRLMVTRLSGQRWHAPWRLVFVLLALFIGLRHEVGGDWGSYLRSIESARGETLFETFSWSEPANSFLNWLASESGLGVYFVNCVFATLFTWGLLAFCRNQPRPWLALVVAVPYMITVVAMGYSRQGAASGLVMLSLVSLEKRSLLKFFILVALAALFHKSAVILLPLAAMAGTRRWFLTLFWVSVTVAVLFVLLLQEAVDGLIQGYVVSEYDSSGAAIRVAMNALPAALLLLFHKQFNLEPAQSNLWTRMAWVALAFVVVLTLSPSSTAVDRVALYIIPLQLFVWSRVPDAMGRSGGARRVWVYAVVGYSASVHFIWLFFGTHNYSWLPYQFYPWVWLWR